MGDFSDLIRAVNAGEPEAQDRLFAAAYGELRQLARSRLRDGGRNTMLDTTALVHDSYMRFIRNGQLKSDDRRAFFAYASRVMRSIIVDAARQRQAERHGGHLKRMTLNTQLQEQIPAATVEEEPDPLQIDKALEQLAQVEPRLAQVVEMRYFGGYSELEIAETLGVTDRTIRRDWNKARLLLAALLQAQA